MLKPPKSLIFAATLAATGCPGETESHDPGKQAIEEPVGEIAEPLVPPSRAPVRRPIGKVAKPPEDVKKNASPEWAKPPKRAEPDHD